jgi:hypothetical protein
MEGVTAPDDEFGEACRAAVGQFSESGSRLSRGRGEHGREAAARPVASHVCKIGMVLHLPQSSRARRATDRVERRASKARASCCLRPGC